MSTDTTSEINTTILEDRLEIYRKLIKTLIYEDSPIFQPNGPFKNASYCLPGKGWRMYALNGGETLSLIDVKLNGKKNDLIFVFTCADCSANLEIKLAVAERHLNDFKEYLLMGLNLDDGGYLSESLLTLKGNLSNDKKTKAETKKKETAEQRQQNPLWGVW